ncbi:MAG: glycine zipper 2TM domain-containing protein [Cypionkella sp.]
MKTSMFKTAGLALAASGLAMAAPAAAGPAPHSAAWDNSAVWSGAKAEHGKKHRRHYNRYDDGRYSNNGYGYQQSYYGEPVYANTRVWQGDDGRYYCRRSNGTTGLLIGAAGGALLGREVAGRYGDRTLGAILGAAGGALLGRSIDRSSTRCR